MKKILDVQRIGFGRALKDLPGPQRVPESFPLPACLTSLVAYLGEDIGNETIQAHGRTFSQRFANKEFLAASGMAFGLLWHPEYCFSALDLSQVNPDHNLTIRRAFDWAGYDCEIVDKTPDAKEALFARIADSIDAGKPLLAFGIVDSPECSIVCGYDRDKSALLGWNHFQSNAPELCAENGMFITETWYEDLWKLVFCGEKKAPKRDLAEVLGHGLGIMGQTQMEDYLAGRAAYAAWIAHLSDSAYDAMPEDGVKAAYRYHHALLGSHAEARCYLGNFLASKAHGDVDLMEAAQCLEAIHGTCWKVWGAAGGINAPDGYRALCDAEKRAELAGLMREIQALDEKAEAAMSRWLKTK